MTVERLTWILTLWHEAMQEAEAQMDALAELTGNSPEAPLQSAVYRLMGIYTTTVAAAINWDDSTLQAWWTEHNFGECPMGIQLPNEPMREISTIVDLVRLIADDLSIGND